MTVARSCDCALCLYKRDVIDVAAQKKIDDDIAKSRSTTRVRDYRGLVPIRGGYAPSFVPEPELDENRPRALAPEFLEDMKKIEYHIQEDE